MTCRPAQAGESYIPVQRRPPCVRNGPRRSRAIPPGAPAAHAAEAPRFGTGTLRRWCRGPQLPVIFILTDADADPPSLSVTVTLAMWLAATV
jgi:hypothetical protein